ncbi:acetyl-CoA carboxylase [Nocardia sp. NBC_00508]|uniref:acetyl-CoA carboxylase n=1 Tax=Nocardia sp. NBC_00508 TaxID=2975992 RepID=UPI002E810378|nr:acetyl-CoA carboxylase [Nocardia sp. NBC_00508]WUD65866.1 acetyl-CoA carboxylase [Nocardia sp. NBC_00508]
MSAYEVVASIPGTFYRRPDPASEPFVEEGAHVSASDMIGLIEVMKTFHNVTAGTAGVVSRFVVADEEAVDVDQVLVVLEVDEP